MPRGFISPLPPLLIQTPLLGIKHALLLAKRLRATYGDGSSLRRALGRALIRIGKARRQRAAHIDVRQNPDRGFSATGTNEWCVEASSESRAPKGERIAHLRDV
ncbi:hypothetical protein QCE47_02270 [Caballeronia sp. LZ025]|jgi:hypothetical protein|uniref:hypothetical protein n=1 Tax=Caballeronia TaxID=1827195 RepID=UPI001FD4DB45|nr:MULTISPECIES: hypothetical protein [Caballeronia]MDR5731176.1 hypothetical protein [Caballeronia sp. LZ025]